MCVLGGGRPATYRNLNQILFAGSTSTLYVLWRRLGFRRRKGDDQGPCPQPSKRELLIPAWLDWYISSPYIEAYLIPKEETLISNYNTNGLYCQPRPNRPMTYASNIWWQLGLRLERERGAGQGPCPWPSNSELLIPASLDWYISSPYIERLTWPLRRNPYLYLIITLLMDYTPTQAR